MQKELRILFLEDSPTDVELIKRDLRKSGLIFTPSLATNREEFIEQLGTFNPDVILSDHSLPQFDSISALRLAKETHPQVPFILVTGSVSEEFAVACIKNGAEDYVLKDNLIRLPSIIEHALNKKDLKAENNLIKNLNNKLNEAYTIIAEKNKDITDSINYSQRIQTAILPHQEELKEYFPDSFILFKPKDTIGGDFYWFAEHRNKFIMAVADCTGHGVPGAMLSMVGFHLLRNIVLINDISQPAEILNKLNHNFCEIFKVGARTEQSINDGMDIAVCSIDKKKMQLDFASAGRPVYIVRGKALHEIKGSLMPIGGNFNDRTPYHNEHMELKKGDRIYMATDGYSDQFGGTAGKKLKTKGLKDFLLMLTNEKITAHRKLLSDFIDTWMQRETQTDDILVAGLEV